MKRAFALLLLVFLSSATFYIQQINVDFYVKDDGSVSAKETIKILVEGETDVARYNAALNKNDLATWAELIGSSDLKVHANTDVVNVKNLEVRPQPLYGHNPLSNTWKGEIVITYDASEYMSDGKPINGTGMFEKKEISPRITEYRLRGNAFSLKETSGGHYILESGQVLTFHLPSKSIVVDINPIPRTLGVKLPAQLESISWTDTILVGLTLVFRIERGMDDEIYSFFKDVEDAVMNLGKTPQGMALLVMVGGILLTYVYLQYRKPRRRT